MRETSGKGSFTLTPTLSRKRKGIVPLLHFLLPPGEENRGKGFL